MPDLQLPSQRKSTATALLPILTPILLRVGGWVGRSGCYELQSISNQVI